MGFFDGKLGNASTVPPEVAECDKKLAALEQKRVENIQAVGQLFVNQNNSKAVAGTEFEPYIKIIEQVAAETVQVQKRKLAVQGLRKCEKCGNILVLDSSFCNKCGDKLEPLFADGVQNKNICSKCGAPHSEGAAFCTSCGNKLG